MTRDIDWDEKYRQRVKNSSTATLQKHLKMNRFNQWYKAKVRNELKRRGAFKSSRSAPRRQQAFGGFSLMPMRNNYGW